MIALDGGALIAIERRSRAMAVRLEQAEEEGLDVLVSVVAVAEVWRDPPSALIARQLRGSVVEPVDVELARAAGRAVGATGASTTDAIVAASASRAGAVLFTTDGEDLRALAEHFHGLRVVAL